MISAQKTFRMLNAIIDNKGDLLEEEKPRYAPFFQVQQCHRHVIYSFLFSSHAERAWFRLSAGCAFLKICEEEGVGDKYSLEQFYTLGSLFTDPVPQVREKIILKLHKVRN